MLLENLLQAYHRYLEVERNASVYTIRNYTRDLLHFLRFLQQEKMDSLNGVDKQVLRKYLSCLIDDGFVKASIARKLSAIRSFYRYLMREGMISSNPLTMISSPKLEKYLPSLLSADEAKRLVEAPDTTTPQGQRDRALLELLYASGLRVSEVISVNLEQVDLIKREIRVWGKGAKERLVLMGKPAVAALQKYMSDGREDLVGKKSNSALFLNRYGKRLSTRRVQYIIARYATMIGLQKSVHPHMLRHTFATHLLDGGADLRVVQELLGHASLASTQIYTHLTQSQARKIYLASHPMAKKGRKKE